MGSGDVKRGLLFVACFAGLCAAMIGKDEIVKETSYKGMVACDVKDACKVKDWMCICQKLMWSREYRSRYILDAGTDDICKKWEKDSDIPDPKCLTKCIIMTQHIDAAAGTDNMVCFKAIEEVKALEKDEKGEDLQIKGHGGFVSFKRIKTTLKRVHRRNHGTSRGFIVETPSAALRLPSISRPANLNPHTDE